MPEAAIAKSLPEVNIHSCSRHNLSTVHDSPLASWLLHGKVVDKAEAFPWETGLETFNAASTGNTTFYLPRQTIVEGRYSAVWSEDQQKYFIRDGGTNITSATKEVKARQHLSQLKEGE